MAPFYGWDSAGSRLKNHYEETVYFLPPSPQKFLVLIWPTLGDIVWHICLILAKKYEFCMILLRNYNMEVFFGNNILIGVV